jgi:hypothetical protein
MNRTSRLSRNGTSIGTDGAVTCGNSKLGKQGNAPLLVIDEIDHISEILNETVKGPI